MPFRIERPQSPGMLPLVLVRDAADGELVWDPRASNATPFDGAEADALVASLNLHDAVVRGVRNTAESEQCQ